MYLAANQTQEVTNRYLTHMIFPVNIKSEAGQLTATESYTMLPLFSPYQCQIQ